MTTAAGNTTRRPALTCLEGGRKHAWQNLGLDVIGDELRSVKRCVWCHVERTRRPDLRLR